MLCTAPIPGAVVTVNFYLGSTLMETATINPGICFTFTKSNFTMIQLSFPATAGATGTTPHWIGDFCVTPRYPVGN
jgi:hypothetical protein